jgi:hypothetical protein
MQMSLSRQSKELQAEQRRSMLQKASFLYEYFLDRR